MKSLFEVCIIYHILNPIIIIDIYYICLENE